MNPFSHDSVCILTLKIIKHIFYLVLPPFNFLLFIFRPASPSRLSVSPIRPVKSPVATYKQAAQGAEVPPPWKQEGYVGESSYTSVATETSYVQSSSTFVQKEQQWEGHLQQQPNGVKEVGLFLLL